MNQLPFERIKRKVLTRTKAVTNEKFGKKPEDRTVQELISYGIVNLNKSQGPTSHQQVDYVKRIFNLKKAGHSGTLDPNVTGVLPIALDKATRIVQVLLKAGKEYIALMHLHKEVSEKKIKESSKKFIGKIEQLPPVRSAVKRQLRTREVYYLNILEIGGQDVLFQIGCEAGTYIRKIIHDWGQELGTGAHMAQLIRTKVGPFNDKNWVSLMDLRDDYEFYKEGDEKKLKKVILPFEKAVEHLPKMWIVDGAIDSICHGADLYVVGISKVETGIDKNNLVAVLSLKNELVCYGTAQMGTEDMVGKAKGIAVKTSKVFMEIGTYEKSKR